ncbi:accessory factor UbiK family protein [Rheinheimera muenzenbergensis]|uniref:Ubiquinone biosynthesis accessory factor UbiK n=1 Tax=Rheinheimera muenzenbergensis TaxID=1193628 RepID=A0ABU8C5X7_9GAMM|nr:accessory factor UbiK family protein [Gammaproteobacteria bacterium]MBU1553880.1 accessory factor UbiK family protein [Gammaproteobacteria bacterium]MBU2069462.1 accessory factor UbiK family protein [Gammaproteobacteria bacterium]MBU2182966.1 accessory factor UbiK family protein [Gammaproteobacteria bacterium]MBU2205877.1 accessory factor UbiK family protein [Gammaproteobacteria bacterium]
MIDPKKIEDIAKQIGNAIPPQVRQFADDIEAKVKQVLQHKLADLDFVSREEFDVQRNVLLRTREKVDKLEQQLTALLAEKTEQFDPQNLPSSDQQ